jgi:hypothetical protein
MSMALLDIPKGVSRNTSLAMRLEIVSRKALRLEKSFSGIRVQTANSK